MPTGLSPALARLSRKFGLVTYSKCGPTTPQRHAAAVWALPFSLATTWGIIIILFSSPYLDVSVQEVGLPLARDIKGCPIRKPADIMLVCSFPRLIAAYRVLRRLSDPRHPPCALISFKNLYIRRFCVRRMSLMLSKNLLSQYVKELVGTMYEVQSTNLQMMGLWAPKPFASPIIKNKRTVILPVTLNL